MLSALIAGEYDRVLQSIIAPEKLVAYNHAGCAEYSETARLVGCCSQSVFGFRKLRPIEPWLLRNAACFEGISEDYVI